MTIEQVLKFYIYKEKTPCPLTERLVSAGYQQRNGGYIKRARQEGKEINYTRNLPSQYWHLMNFCYSRPPQENFTKTIQCGELIFWMAEVADCVPNADMAALIEEIIKNAIKNNGEHPIYDRKHWNKEIQRLCFDAIKSKVESSND